MSNHDDVDMFSPEDITVIYAAYTSALDEIQESEEYFALSPRDLRRRVASAVIAEAQRGITDKNALKCAGLEAIAVCRSA